MNDEIVVVASISDSLEAEILHSLLESFGIQVWLSREAASTAVGLTVGPFAQVDLLVHKAQEEQAKKILEDYYTGNLEINN
jgi:Holliday junction resolvasome RuvABC ATP-dependent DNA helicase subunit